MERDEAGKAEEIAVLAVLRFTAMKSCISHRIKPAVNKCLGDTDYNNF